MAKQSTVLSCASNRSSLGLAATLAFLLLTGASVILRVRSDNWDLPFAPVFGNHVRGVTYNGLTGERLGDTYIECGSRASTSDDWGRFAIDLGGPKPNRCTVGAPGFEPKNIEAWPGESVVVRLAPDPTGVITQVVQWEKEGRFDKQYELLHPDVSRSWTVEEFARLLRLTEDDSIISFEMAEPYFLKRWNNYGEVYFNVAVVPVQVSFDRDGRIARYDWEAHLVKRDGFWRWFREPLVEVVASGLNQ